MITPTTHITYSDNCHQQTKYKKSEEILRPAGACRSHVVGTHRICEHRAASCAGTRTPTGKCCHSGNWRAVRVFIWQVVIPASTESVLWVDRDRILGPLLCYLTLPQEAGHPVWVRHSGGHSDLGWEVIQCVLGECLLAFYSFVLLFPFFVYS